MTREPSGICSPASPSGYPPPSQLSCEERTSAATPRSAGMAARIRTPSRVWRPTCSLSASLSGVTLARGRVGYPALADVVELAGVLELSQGLAREPEPLAHGRHSRATSLKCASRAGLLAWMMLPSTS